MVNTLVKNKKYCGKFVAIKSINDTKILGSGLTPIEAYREAIAKGYQNPTILFVPLKDVVQIY